MQLHIKANERGHADFGWLNSHHSFSFGQYHNPNRMGFRSLRVINDDRVAAGGGFPTHPHRDMEILSYVLEGGLEHRDSIGTGSVIKPGDVQRMSAGSGIRHSEFNASKTEPVHFLQIWLLPEAQNIEPGYEQKAFSVAEKTNTLRLVGSRDGRDGSITIHQDVDLYATLLNEGTTLTHEIAPGRGLFVQAAQGGAIVNGVTLAEGDGLALDGEKAVTLTGVAGGGELLVFDLGD